MFYSVSLLLSRVVTYNLSRRMITLCFNTKLTEDGFNRVYCDKIYKSKLLLLTSPIQQYSQRLLSDTVLKCWKCGTIRYESKELFCQNCNVLQKPDPNPNLFHIIGVDTKYEQEISTLTRNYRRLQNVLHPDRFSNSHEEEIKISEEYSSLINKAYFTLLQPLSRGLYMLEMNGIFIEESTKQSSPEFLMEIMEENEEVDAAIDTDKLRELTSRNKASLAKLERDLAEAFNNGNLKQAEASIIKMKYYASIASKIKDIKQKKGLED